MITNLSSGVLARLTITNLLWVALLGASWHQGWLQYIFTKDVTFISHGIAISALLVVILSFWKGMTLSKLLRNPEATKEEYGKAIERVGARRQSDIRDALRTRLMSFIAFVEFYATTALAVGVIGTVIGLILGFANVDPAAIANVSNAGATVAELLVGLSVAFHTTLVGGIVNLWLRTNHFFLMQANADLYATIMEG